MTKQIGSVCLWSALLALQATRVDGAVGVVATIVAWLPTAIATLFATLAAMAIATQLAVGSWTLARHYAQNAGPIHEGLAVVVESMMMTYCIVVAMDGEIAVAAIMGLGLFVVVASLRIQRYNAKVLGLLK